MKRILIDAVTGGVFGGVLAGVIVFGLPLLIDYFRRG